MIVLRRGWLAARQLGPEALFFYARYRIALASGAVRRRTPLEAWDQRPFPEILKPKVPGDPDGYAAFRAAHPVARFFFDADRPGLPWKAAGPPPQLMEEAGEIAQGKFRLFGGPPVELGVRPDWHAAPAPGASARFDSGVHWTEIPLDSPGLDARQVWELSRFGWLLTLARAFRWTGEAGPAEIAWGLLEDWARANPPNLGVHWASAQEAGLRLLALGFAERAFLPAWRSRPRRLLAVARMVGAHARRILSTLDYARAQNNNHLLSEAAGLLTAGLLFPELRGSDRWLRIGRSELERGLERQVLADGGYVQHSANYQRLALMVGVWGWRLAEENHCPLSRAAGESLGRLARGLAALVDPTSGEIPGYGPDDGSLVVRLAPGAARDSRPELEAAARSVLGESWFGDGPWAETSRWLGTGSGRAADLPRPATLPESGLHFLRGTETRGMLRAVRFRGRPGHSDQLHLDLLWKGTPLAFDPGSYLYAAPPPLEGGLAEAAVHNLPLLDRREPMHRAGRFLWVASAQARITGRWESTGWSAIRAERDDPARKGERVERTVALVDGRSWLIVDSAFGAGQASLLVGWNLPPVPWRWGEGRLDLVLAQGEVSVGWDPDVAHAGLARAGAWEAGDPVSGPLGVWGWFAPRYGTIEPCLRLVLEARGPLPLEVRTRFFAAGEASERLNVLWETRTRFAPEAGE